MFYPVSEEKCEIIGPVSFDGPSHKEFVLLLDEILSNVDSFKNIGCGGIGPLIDDKPSHIFSLIRKNKYRLELVYFCV